MVSITLPDNYGAAIAVAVGAIPFLAITHTVVTGSFRQSSGVPYPHAYATVEQTKSNPKAYQFNCAQRAHANFLEHAPQTMIYILVAGLKYPEISAALGIVWVSMRALYLHGYVYSSKPEGRGRHHGGLFYLPQAALWGLSVFGVARDFIKW